MRVLTILAALGVILLSAHQSGAQERAVTDALRVVLDKSQSLTLTRQAASVIVGQPQIADVTVVTPRRIILIGKKVGETSLVILDSQGQTLIDASLTVVPEAQRHVTIHKGAEGVLTLSCSPRCSGVDNPGTEAAPKGDGGGAGAGGGAPLGGGLGGAAPAGAAPSAAAGAPSGGGAGSGTSE